MSYRLNGAEAFAVLFGLGITAPAPLLAEDVPTRPQILACLDAMGDQTNWDQCRRMMFTPCATHDVGSEPHLTCLADDMAGWEALMAERRSAVTEALTPSGASELGGLMGQWFGYVSQKCAAVGVERAGISEEAATLGCRISELAGLTQELDACLAGASTAPYCTLKDM